MFDNKELSTRQTDELFCDTAHRKPVRAIAVAREGTTEEAQVPSGGRAILRAAPIVAGGATVVQRAIEVEPEAGRRKHQVVTEFFPGAVIRGAA